MQKLKSHFGRVFSCKFAAYFQNTLFQEHLFVVACVSKQWSDKTITRYQKKALCQKIALEAFFIEQNLVWFFK